MLTVACVSLANCSASGDPMPAGGGAVNAASSTTASGFASAAMGSGPSQFDQPVGRGRSGLASDGPSAAPASSAGTVPIRLLHGKVVVIDPGHNGENFRHPAVINRKVFIGTGMKACNTTGTETNAGYSEAAFTFDVSLRLAALLRAAGATVVLTRNNNHGVGPCVDQRAAIGNRAHADAAISIHGDGAPASGYGFHVIVPRGIGSNDTIVAPSRRLGVLVRDAFRAGTGEALSTYTGKTTGAIVARDDLGGLNLSAVPMVFIECGNMRNAADARRMTTQVWRQRAAAALADGITRYLANDG